MNLQQLLTTRRAEDVERFHMFPTLRRQNIASHSFGVCNILMFLYGATSIQVNLLKAALFHDLVEIETGDIPATAKWEHPDLEAVLKKVESEWLNKNGFTVLLTNTENAALKFADMADLMFFCLEEIHMGNQKAKAVLNRGFVVLKTRIALLKDTPLYENACLLLEFFNHGFMNGGKYYDP